jgi:hypothetical protein
MPFISQPIKGFLSHTGVPQIIQKSTILVLTYILKAMGRGTSVLRRLQMDDKLADSTVGDMGTVET